MSDDARQPDTRRLPTPRPDAGALSRGRRRPPDTATTDTADGTWGGLVCSARRMPGVVVALVPGLRAVCSYPQVRSVRIVFVSAAVEHH
ncbi:hypothetical protein [Streptomyces lydicus]|uniref:hypothetical protein n=1 Tax=Streptomyces lydicus TaxID=47763 RepID=UPI001013AB1F|nr:hypothetical protein [Streptomyces lydicus]